MSKYYALGRPEIGEISDHIAALFGGKGAGLTTLRYYGPMASLSQDLELETEETPVKQRHRKLFLRKHD